jgi:hypothetical protein
MTDQSMTGRMFGMGRSSGRMTLLMLGVVIVVAVALGIVFGTDLVFASGPIPFPLIAGAAALACLLILRLRTGPGGRS